MRERFSPGLEIKIIFFIERKKYVFPKKCFVPDIQCSHFFKNPDFFKNHPSWPLESTPSVLNLSKTT